MESVRNWLRIPVWEGANNHGLIPIGWVSFCLVFVGFGVSFADWGDRMHMHPCDQGCLLTNVTFLNDGLRFITEGLCTFPDRRQIHVEPDPVNDYPTGDWNPSPNTLWLWIMLSLSLMGTWWFAVAVHIHCTQRTFLRSHVLATWVSVFLCIALVGLQLCFEVVEYQQPDCDLSIPCAVYSIDLVHFDHGGCFDGPTRCREPHYAVTIVHWWLVGTWCVLCACLWVTGHYTFDQKVDDWVGTDEERLPLNI